MGAGYIPLVVSVAIAALSRFMSNRLWPRAAVWAIAAAALTVTAASVGALVLLASPLPAQVPLVATLGRWKPSAVASHTPTPVWVSVAALVLLVFLAWRTLREVRTLRVDLSDAAQLRRAIGGKSTGGVVVIDDDVPAAHAVGGVISRAGAIVVTSSMLELLDADERAAVLAHERAHLRQRHAVFMAVARLAAALNPILAGVPADMAFALERWADEEAATVSERSALASAIAKAALGALTRSGPTSIAAGAALHHHGVTDRVAALLAEPNRRTRPALAFVALSVVAALALAWATHSTERFFEAVRVWSHR